MEKSDLINYTDPTEEEIFDNRSSVEASSMATTVNTSLSSSSSTTTSQKNKHNNASNNVVHVLPSFHMHQSVLNKSVFEETSFKDSTLPSYDPSDGYSSTNRTNSTGDAINMNDCHDSILANIDELRTCNKQLDLQLTLMRHPCFKDQVNNEPESALKEYTSGDYIYGYFTLKNISKQDIRFEQVMVSLEGYSLIPQKSGSGKKRNVFLRMCDLGSGFTFAALPTNDTGVVYCFDIDKDGCRMGLPHSQVLKPGIVYKKFFEFKLPLQLLDESCATAQSSHLLVPPTFGYDDRFDIPGSRLFNEQLGYARTDNKESPISFRDHCPTDFSINYTVNVRVIGTNPEKDNNQFKYALYKQSARFIRFIPFGFCIPFEYGLSTPKQLELLYNHIESELEAMKKRIQYSLDPTQPIPWDVYSDEELWERKQRQLALNDSNPNNAANIPIFPLPNSTKEAISQMTSLKILQKKSRFSSNRPGDVVGTLDILSLRPSDGIPYAVPSIVHKINAKSQMDPTGRSNIHLMGSALTTIEKKNLQEIELELVYKPNNNAMKPPSLETILVDLEMNTVYSKNSIPFTIDQDFITDRQQFTELKNKFNDLAQQFKRYGKDAKIRRDVLEELNSILNLKWAQESLPYYKIAHKEVSLWSAEQDHGSGKIKWIKKIKLQLQHNNMRNLTLIPTFQSCYISRFYNIKLKTSYDNGTKASLNIPVRVRKFDWQS